MDEMEKPTVLPIPHRRRSLIQQLAAQDFANDPQAFARLITEMRERAGLSRAALARQLGINASSLKQYENGRRGRSGKASLRWFLRSAAACGHELSLELPNGKSFDLVLGPASLRESRVGFVSRD